MENVACFEMIFDLHFACLTHMDRKAIVVGIQLIEMHAALQQECVPCILMYGGSFSSVTLPL